MDWLKKIFSKYKKKEQTLSSNKAFQQKESLSEKESNTDDENNESTKSEMTEIIGEDATIVMRVKASKNNPATLLLLSGPEDIIGISWILDKSSTSVGRSSQFNEIKVSHPSLSKKHFKMLKEGNEFYVVDLKSTNKTYLNDKMLNPYERVLLRNNDYIKASSVVFKFLDKGNIESSSSQQMLNKAWTDSLTGAGNRQFLSTKGVEYFNYNENLCLIVFDIDDFKSINDSLGHTGGDYVLKTISKNVLDTIRSNDLFIRYGGDEFCIFVPQSLSMAQKIAQRIKDKVEKNKFSFNKQMFTVGISIGLTEKIESDKCWEDIYHRADILSYKEKRARKRNRETS